MKEIFLPCFFSFMALISVECVCDCMPKINTYKCSDCDYEFPMGWGGYTYVVDDNGNRVVCPHPAEVSQIADTLNIENKIVIYE